MTCVESQGVVFCQFPTETAVALLLAFALVAFTTGFVLGTWIEYERWDR